MKIFSLFIESMRVANQMGNARSQADLDLAAQQIGACCDKNPKRDSAADSAGEAGVFDGPFAKQT